MVSPELLEILRCPMDPSNTKTGKVRQAAIDAERAAWLARFRPQPAPPVKPTLADVLALLDKAREMIAAM